MGLGSNSTENLHFCPKLAEILFKARVSLNKSMFFHTSRLFVSKVESGATFRDEIDNRKNFL
jgi:hypothetical protein